MPTTCSMHTWFHLVPEPIRASACPKQAPPLCPESDVRRQQSERKDYRLFYETLAYVAKTLCQETLHDTITNLTAEPVCLRPRTQAITITPTQQQTLFYKLAINGACILQTYY